MNYQIKNLFLAFCLLLAYNTWAQEDQPGKFWDLGLEAQQYPTGYLLGLRVERVFGGHHGTSIRLGYNGLDHQDFGVHESEIGGGFGGTLGYRYYFRSDYRGFFLGARVDLWQNSMDWKDDIGKAIEVKGQSEVWVLQPTVIAGYLFLIKDHWIISPTLAFGAEINIKTTGAPVGEGGILLWGLNLAYRL